MTIIFVCEGGPVPSGLRSSGVARGHDQEVPREGITPPNEARSQGEALTISECKVRVALEPYERAPARSPGWQPPAGRDMAMADPCAPLTYLMHLNPFHSGHPRPECLSSPCGSISRGPRFIVTLRPAATHAHLGDQYVCSRW